MAMAEGALDDRTFRISLALGLRTALVIVRDHRLDMPVRTYEAIQRLIQDCVDQAEGKEAPTVVDGAAEYASWFPTLGEIEVASWSRSDA